MDGPRIPRSPILRLQPIMETQFKSRKPQQKVSVVICGLRISSLANLQRELFREPGMAVILNCIVDNDSTQLEC
ncbi:hypothetical protein AAC387_Pa01g2185 [Persea americana]